MHTFCNHVYMYACLPTYLHACMHVFVPYRYLVTQGVQETNILLLAFLLYNPISA